MYTNWTDRAIPLFVLSIAAEVALGLWQHGGAMPGAAQVAKARAAEAVEFERERRRSSAGRAAARISARAPIYSLADTLTSVSLGTLQQLTNVVVIRSLLIVPVCFLWERYALLRLAPDSVWTHVACFVLVEHGYYWYHRLGHEVNFFWAFHAVHHTGELYNLATALRQGWAQYAFAFLFFAPIGLVIPPEVYTLYAHANRIYQFWIHTAAVGTLPAPIEFVFCTPSHHRVHHGSNPEYVDKNYGGTVIVFDRLFGTFEPERAPVVYGLTSKVETWNPVAINAAHFGNMARVFADAGSSWAALRVLWRGPGWTARGDLPLPPADYARLTHEGPAAKRTPRATAYAALLCIEAVVLLKIATRSVYSNGRKMNHLPSAAVLTGVIVATAGTMGLVLDRSRYARAAELARLAAILAAGTLLTAQDPGNRVLASTPVIAAVCGSAACAWASL
jgi:alkylglycerol monooxygenase